MAHVVYQNFRERSLWVRTSNQAWFDMADMEFYEQQWYENFRVTRDTFQFILNEIEREITHEIRQCVKLLVLGGDSLLYCTTYLLQQNTALLQIFLEDLQPYCKSF